MHTIFLLHGALGAQAQLQPLSRMLTPFYRVKMFSFSGHGGVPFAPDFSIQQFAGELLAAMDAHSEKEEKVTLFGYSMGGYVAAHAAQQAPERVARMITLATKWHWNPESAAREAAMADADAIAAKVPAFAAQLAERHGAEAWKTLLQRTRVMLHDMGVQPPLPPDSLGSFPVPVCLLSGDRDKTVPPEETLDIYRRLPQAKLGILPGTAHPFEKVNLPLLVSLIQDECGE